MLRSTTGVIVFATAALASAQLAPPKPAPLVGARDLALSPDGKRLAFTYRGDVWVAPSSGGPAIPITNHVEMDSNPVWSPNGSWIAFASNRNGGNDIYLAPVSGGETVRLTYYPGNNTPSDWTPDGKSIVFRGSRDDRWNSILSVDVADGRNDKLFKDMMSIGSPIYAPDGKSVIYTRFGFPWYRARYEGSAAAQLWRYDLASGKRTQIRNNGLQHLWPSLNSSGLFAVTVAEKTPSSSPVDKPIPKITDNPNRTPNVYEIESNGRARRLTNYVEAPVRFLTAAKKADLLAFERDGDLYTMKPGESPQRIEVTAILDDKTTQLERLILTEGASNAAFSPNGEKVVFELRGELWMIPTKRDEKSKSPNKNDAVQLTTWEGTDDQPIFAPDNRTLYFVSDRDGAERLYKMDTETKAVTPITTDDADVSNLQITPDKASLSFWKAGANGGLYTVSLLLSGTPRRVMARPGQAMYYNWSPDMRFVAYSETLLRSGYYYWEATQNIHIYDVELGLSHNVTQLSAQHIIPTFSPDGKGLFFRSDRNGAGLYYLSFAPEDAREPDEVVKYEKPAAPVKVEIDWSRIERRPRRIGTVQPESQILVHPEKGDVYFLNGGDVYRCTYAGEEGKKITNGGGFADIAFADDYKSLAGVRNGQPTTVDIQKPNNEVKSLAFRSDWRRDLVKEHRAAYDQFWRLYNRGFYDGNFHGRDWKELRERYRKYMPSVAHRNEMAVVLNMMVGELESSHSEVGSAPGNPRGESVANLGFTFDYRHRGPGIKVLDVPPYAPGSYPKTRLSPGEIVLKVNGLDASPTEAFYRDCLNEQEGRDLKLTVQGTDGKTREVTYRALSNGQFSNIEFENLLDARRKKVEEASNGNVTYVHIAGMGGPQLDRFNQEVWMYASGKKALIIDVRNNGGGNTADRIIDVLERLPNSIYKPRDEATQLGPGQALAVPMVVLCDETSFSNAEMFPSAMKARKLATIVGRPTPGYVIYTSGGRLVDGTSYRMPGTGVYRLDGTPLENMGVQPDVIVERSPEQFFNGQDPQLERAVEILMRAIR
jgi:Tol biopolymer transport system component/C-terminal processing protease CtpA/Prc